MEKENARKQTLEQLYERRKQVVRLHKKAIKIMQIVAMTGLSHPAVRVTFICSMLVVGPPFDRLLEDALEAMGVCSLRCKKT